MTPTCRRHGDMQVAEEGVLNGVLRRYWWCPAPGCRREERTDETHHDEPTLLFFEDDV